MESLTILSFFIFTFFWCYLQHSLKHLSFVLSRPQILMVAASVWHLLIRNNNSNKTRQSLVHFIRVWTSETRLAGHGRNLTGQVKHRGLKQNFSFLAWEAKWNRNPPLTGSNVSCFLSVFCRLFYFFLMLPTAEACESLGKSGLVFFFCF